MCTLCQAGKAGSNEDVHNRTLHCGVCGVGKYSTAAGATMCEECPDHSTTLEEQSTAEADCKCNRGYEAEDGGTCAACGVGLYKDTLGSAACTQCMPDSSSKVASDSKYDCVCALGYGRAASDQTCTICPIGKYNEKDANNLANTDLESWDAMFRECRDCVGTATTNGTGSTSADQCSGCKPGEYAKDGQCLDCPPTTYTTNTEGVESCRCDKGYYGRGVDSENEVWCTACPEGTYKRTADGANTTSNSSVCELCEVHTYSNRTAQVSAATCTTCMPNSHTDAAGTTSIDGCICDPGFERDPDSAPDTPACLQCPAGKYGIREGGACVDCAAGKYSNLPQRINEDACRDCSAGKYNPAPGAAECLLCAAGTYSGATGANSSATCVECVAGTYLHHAGAQSSDGCTPCPAGTYSTAPGANNSTQCVDCQSGTYSTTPGANTSALCIECQAGTYSTASGAGSAETCTECPTGKYSTVVGASSNSTCTDCPAGTFSGAQGAHSNTTCDACAAGKYSSTLGAVDVSTCINCGVGTYSTVVGAGSNVTCVDCLAGTYSAALGADSSSTCLECAAGTYSTAPGASNIAACTRCGVGTYSTASGASSNATCTDCPAGTYSGALGADSNITCTACYAGKYSTSLGASSLTACLECPAGTFSTASGASSNATCTGCATGTYSTATGASSVATCLNCAAGTYSTAPGADSAGTCLYCAAGKYSAAAGSTACNNCSGGTYLPVSGANSSDACILCAAGKKSVTEGAISEDTCEECPAGSIAGAGATTCDGCGPGEYAEGEECVGCPVDTYCTPSGVNVLCVDTEYGAETWTGGAERRDHVTDCVCRPGWYRKYDWDPDTDRTYKYANFYTDPPTPVSLVYGHTYTFLMDAAHPLLFTTTTEHTKSGDTVVALGVEGETNMIVTIPMQFSDDLWLHCAKHSNMPKIQITLMQSPCFACPEASVCPGTENARAECPPHHWSPAQSSVPGNCTCDVGYRDANGTCTDCRAGTYKNNTGPQACTECPVDTYSTALAAVSADTCLACQANSTTMNHTGRFYARACACNAGFRHNGTQPECIACSSGYFNPERNRTECSTCAAGKFSSEAAAVSNATCEDCGLHEYSDHGAGECDPCPDNAVTEDSGSSDVSQCMCDAGFSGPDGGECAACGAGEYKQNVGAAACTQCPPDSWHNVSNASSPARCLCNAGYFGIVSEHYSAPVLSELHGNSQDHDSSPAAPCTICPAGKYKDTAGNAECQAFPAQADAPAGSTAATDCACNAGYTGPDGGPCAACGVGTYKDAPGSDQCAACDARVRNSTTQTNASTDGGAQCLCPPGTFLGADGDGAPACLACAIGAYQPAWHQDGCVACPARRSTRAAASVDARACVCVPGSSFNATGTGGCEQCAALSFKADLGDHACTQCPENTWTHPGATALQNCTCELGYQADADGEACAACTAGKFKNTTGAGECTDCPRNTYTEASALALRSVHDCLHCPAGQSSLPGEYGPVNESCKDVCSYGQKGDPSIEPGCTVCPAGSYNDELAQPECKLCPQNSFSDEGAKYCECGPGFTGHEPRREDSNTSCTACPVGTYKNTLWSAPCTLCEPGKYQDKVEQILQSSCLQCDAGKYQPLAGAGNVSGCLLCPAGTFSTDLARTNLSDCEPCPAGTYSDVLGRYYECDPCGAGTYSDATGASNASTCTPCPAGTYTETFASGLDALSACELCAAGTYSNETGQNSDTTCQECGPGTYQPLQGAAAVSDCRGCPAGKKQPLAGQSWESDCVACALG